MKKQVIIVFFILWSIAVSAQKKYVAHQVQKGETLYSLAIKYNTSIKKILKFNPDISKETGVQEGKLLIIQSKAKTPISDAYLTHRVKKRETLFGLSRKYDVSEAAIQKANPIIADKGLMCGLEIKIPKKEVKGTVETTETEIADTTNIHVVKKGETIFSITHQYAISEATLRKNNPQIINNDLPLGMKLDISKEQEVILPTKQIDTVYTRHLVLPKETVFSITHLYGIDKEQLVKLNPNFPAIKDNILHPDDVLIIKKIIISKDTETQQIDSLFVGEKKSMLTRIIAGKQIDMALLLPLKLKAFNYANNDSLRQEIKKNKGLNRVLEFYNGSLMAIDSIAKLGVQLNVDVYDTESKNSVALLKLIREGKLNNKDILIGPFYTENVALVAQNLTNENTLLVAPFNKKIANHNAVLNAKVPKEMQQVKMLDFLSNNYTDEQIIYIDDASNPTAKALILARFKNVKVLMPHEKTKAISFKSMAEAVGVNEEGLLINKKANKDYWVIVNSNKDWFIGSIVSAFNSLQGKVNITLFSTAYYKAFNEINPNHLANLNYHFPATTNQDGEDAIFSKKYQAKYGVRPSSLVIKGFDATFDALLRVCVAEDLITEALLYEKNKGIATDFQYRKSPQGGYQNEGVQVLKYTKDLHQVEAEAIKKDIDTE
jgi:LysM repeat protein